MFCPVDSYTLSDGYAPSMMDDDFVVLVVLVVVILVAFCLVLCKVFVTNRITPRGNVLALGLDESSATETELYGRNIPWRKLFLYAAVGVTTFEFGVFVYETYVSIQERLPSLNGVAY